MKMLRIPQDKSKRAQRSSNAWDTICAHFWQAANEAVVARDGLACRYCGDTRAPITMDHIKPKCKGGDHYRIDNLQVACVFCNKLKGGTNIEDFQAGLNHYRKVILGGWTPFYGS